MYQSKVDVAVLLIFFNRPECIEKVFAAVKAARPSRLYLYQDGVREGREDDVENARKCREIVSDIDWECEVHTKYQEKNFGCDPSEFIAQRWLFENEEMGIILEDDDVPSESFFRFCKELLEKYKDDDRINMICGMNNNDISKYIDASYLFTKKGSIWGWASWRRVVSAWDGEYSWLDDEKALEKIKKQMSNRDYKAFIKRASWHRSTGKEYYETINAASMYINERLNIVPKYNMISNIGISAETTHATDDVRVLPKRIQKLLYKKTYEIEFPLIHPTEIVRDYKFEKKMTFTKFDRFANKIEATIRTLIYKGPKGIIKKIKNHSKSK
ncbi:MAG: hemolysin activation protein [Clostridia bacterium]|nr:hemolysin activation protein [Clostridia bacterium]